MKVCSFQRSQWRAQICHLQAAVTCRQQNRGSRKAGVGRGQTGVRCLYFPCGGLWLLWSLCHTTISNSSNSNAEGVEWETKSSYFSIRARQKDRLARREKETESNGGGKSLCDSSLLKKRAVERQRSGVSGSLWVQSWTCSLSGLQVSGGNQKAARVARDCQDGF